MSMNAAGNTAHIPQWTTGDRLRKARITAGYNQDEMARETSISKRQIIYYENDSKVPSRGDFLLWQFITGAPAEWLRTGHLPPDDGGRLTQEFRVSPPAGGLARSFLLSA